MEGLRLNGCIVEWLNKWMNEGMEETNERRNKVMNQLSEYIIDKHC